MHSLGVREKSDERILGSGEFVEQLIQQSARQEKSSFPTMSVGNALFHMFTESAEKSMVLM